MLSVILHKGIRIFTLLSNTRNFFNKVHAFYIPSQLNKTKVHKNNDLRNYWPHFKVVLPTFWF